MNFIHIFTLSFFITALQAANILVVIPFTSKSHYILLSPIGLELASRGHNVTVFTAFREDRHPPNYHQVMVEDITIWEATGTGRPNVFTMAGMPAEQFHDNILWRGGLAFTEIALKSKEIQHFLQQDNEFDVVIAEHFFQEAFFILAHKYKAPLILATTYGNSMRHNIIIRNPLQLATVIPEFLDVREPQSFWGRLRSVYFTAYEYFWWRLWYIGKQEALVKKYIPDLEDNVPSLIDLERDAAILFTNSHFSYDVPMALLPNVIEVGGLHLKESDTQLPADLKKILDDAKEGVVYVNFGSNVRSSELPEEKKQAFLNAFRRLNQTVLWKWEDDNVVGMPNNVYVRKWMPQKQILAHPNVKLFFAHGGLIGMQESMFSAVPIIGLPIYADQYNNLLQSEQIGFGKILEYNDITESKLYTMIQEVLTSQYYRNKAKYVSKRFKDRPMSALDTAMYWIEYVIRNKDTEYMKNPARNMSWVEYNMLDVYGFFTLLFLVFMFCIVKIVLVIVTFLFNSKSKSKRVAKNEKKTK